MTTIPFGRGPQKDPLLAQASDLPQEIAPPRDLWPAIAAKLAEQSPAAPRRFAWPMTLAAGFLIAAVSALLTWGLMRDPDLELRLGGRQSVLRAARLLADAPRGLLTFAPWGKEVRALDSTGVTLWTHPGGQGIDDVWPADLDGDGLDEVIVGYNGGTGLQVLDHEGKPRWSDTTIGNVWYVTAGEIEGGGRPEVITTSASGKVHIFDATGRKLRDLDAGLYGNMVRFAPAAESGKPGTIIVGGTSDEGEALAALAANGTPLWHLALSDGKGHIDAALVAPGKPWLAALLRDGRVVVVELGKGTIIAQSTGEASRGDIAWIETKDAPLLVFTTATGLSAYRIAVP